MNSVESPPGKTKIKMFITGKHFALNFTTKHTSGVSMKKKHVSTTSQVFCLLARSSAAAISFNGWTQVALMLICGISMDLVQFKQIYKSNLRWRNLKLQQKVTVNDFNIRRNLHYFFHCKMIWNSARCSKIEANRWAFISIRQTLTNVWNWNIIR